MSEIDEDSENLVVKPMSFRTVRTEVDSVGVGLCASILMKGRSTSHRIFS